MLITGDHLLYFLKKDIKFNGVINSNISYETVSASAMNTPNASGKLFKVIK